MASRSDQLTHPIWEGKELDLMPLTTADISDSANLDRTAELMLHTGEGIDKALMVLIPEAYANHPDLDANYPEVKDFYRFYEGMQVRLLSVHASSIPLCMRLRSLCVCFLDLAVYASSISLGMLLPRAFIVAVHASEIIVNMSFLSIRLSM